MTILLRITIAALVGFAANAAPRSQPRIHQGQPSAMHIYSSLETRQGSNDSAEQFKFTVSPNYPNPFRIETTINYVLPTKSFVEITIYDARGARIRTLVNESEISGAHSVMWDGKNHLGQVVPAGSYYYRAVAGDFHISRRMQLVK
jgi:hypothetical protein